MKLHDALRMAVREAGVSVLKDRRLLFLLSDYRAFDDCPAMRQVMKAVAEGGYGKELYRLSWRGDDDRSEYLSYAESLKETLAEEKHFRREFADYAADSVSFALGFISAPAEPRDHGFDPMESSSRQEAVGASCAGAAPQSSGERAPAAASDRSQENDAAGRRRDPPEALSAGASQGGVNAGARQGTASAEVRSMACAPGNAAADTWHSGKGAKADCDAAAADAPAPEMTADESVTPGMSRRASGILYGVIGGVIIWVMVMSAGGMHERLSLVPLLLLFFVIAGAAAGWCFSAGSGRRSRESPDAGESQSHSVSASSGDEEQAKAREPGGTREGSGRAAGLVIGGISGLVIGIIAISGTHGETSSAAVVFFFVMAGVMAGWCVSGRGR